MMIMGRWICLIETEVRSMQCCDVMNVLENSSRFL
jgi:hypothetical protein